MSDVGYQGIFRRREIKYIIDSSQREAIGRILEQNGMHVDEYGNSLICSIYYDTPSYRIIRTSMEKPIYKEKLRIRTYGVPTDSSVAFAELKKKYKGIVYKRRVMLPYSDAVAWLSDPDARGIDSQIGREIDYFKKYYEPLAPTAAILYDRVAYYSDRDDGVRVTFDENIRYRFDDTDLRSGPHGNVLTPEGMYIMEIKLPLGMPLWMASALSELGIFPHSFSKYANAYKKDILKIQPTY